VVALGASVLLAGLVRLRRVTLARLLQGFFILLAVAAVSNCDGRLVRLRGYGDQNLMGAMLEARRSEGDLTAPSPRVQNVNTHWLLGSVVLREAYRAYLPLARSHPWMLLAGTPFVRATGAVLMALASVLLLRRHGGRLAVLLPLLTPVWLLFSAGYDEYYPFIAWMFLVLVLWLDRDLARRPPVAVGFFAGVLILAYLGYTVVAMLLLLTFWTSAGTRRGLVALALALLVAQVGVWMCWPGPRAMDSYCQHLLCHDLIATEVGEIHASYAGRALVPWLPLFRPAFALSLGHLADLASMLILGAGPVCLVLLAWRLPHLRILTRREHRFVGLLLGVQAGFFLFMVPSLGPVQDVDLFFTVYLSAAFTAGLLADHWMEHADPERRQTWHNTLALAQLSSSLVVLTYLLGSGM